MSDDPLTAAALLGTSRMSSFPAAPHAILAEAWEALPGDDAARAVLQAAALEAIARRAGRLPIEGVELPAPSRNEETLPTPPAAVAALQRMLKGEFAQGLGEWLRHARENGRTAPARLLPALFAHGTGHRNLRPAIRSVAGERGVWLARHKEEWSWVVEEDAVPDDAWELGTHAERLAWLRETRATDPVRAAGAIAADWAGESAGNRESFALLAAESPLPEDESWLESLALADRRRSTRQAAVRALVSLPSSAFRRRVLERAGKLLAVKGGWKRVLELTPPGRFDEEWAADGIGRKPPAGRGETGWWARQMLAQVPLPSWPEVLGVSAGELFSLKRDPDWEETILHGWLDSIQSQPALLPGLLPFLLSLPGSLEGEARQAMKALLGSLPSGVAGELLEPLRVADDEVLALLAHHQPLVDPERMPRLAKTLTGWLDARQSPITGPQAVALAMCPVPAAIPGLLQHIARLPALSSAAEEFARALEFRQSYLPHFTARSARPG